MFGKSTLGLVTTGHDMYVQLISPNDVKLWLISMNIKS